MDLSEKNGNDFVHVPPPTTPPPAKRRRLPLYLSPQHPSSSSPSTSNDFTGYIIDVTELSPSKKGNPYFDVIIRTTPEKTDSVRVMHHDAAKRQLFINKQEARQPVTLTNVNLAKSGMKFFNINTTSKLEDAKSIDFTFQEKDASHGLITLKGKPKDSKFNVTGAIKWTNEIRKVTIKRNNAEEKLMDVRDGVIADSTWQIPISVWHNLIPQVQDNTWYNLTAVKIRKYQGERLATTDSTVITPAEINENLDWSTILKQVQEEAAATTPATPKLCCPVILGVNINVYAICNNLDKCKRKKVYPLPGEKTVKCTNCRKSMLLTRAPCGMTGEVFLEKGDQTMTLTIFPNTLTTYFQEHVLDAYKDNPEQLEERILNLTNLDITYNLKKIVTKIENHVD